MRKEIALERACRDVTLTEADAAEPYIACIKELIKAQEPPQLSKSQGGGTKHESEAGSQEARGTGSASFPVELRSAKAAAAQSYCVEPTTAI